MASDFILLFSNLDLDLDQDLSYNGQIDFFAFI